MSQFLRITTKMSDPMAVVAAVEACGYKEMNYDKKGENTIMFEGDIRSESTKCFCVVGNEFGFYRNNNGTISACSRRWAGKAQEGMNRVTRAAIALETIAIHEQHGFQLEHELDLNPVNVEALIHVSMARTV